MKKTKEMDVKKIDGCVGEGREEQRNVKKEDAKAGGMDAKRCE